jgi:hypothetical protein
MAKITIKKLNRRIKAFPRSPEEIDHVAELILEHAEALTEVGQKSREEELVWGAWSNWIPELETWIADLHLSLPPGHEPNYQDVAAMPVGEARDVVALYTLLLEISGGKKSSSTVEHQMRKDEIAHHFLQILDHLERAKSRIQNLEKRWPEDQGTATRKKVSASWKKKKNIPERNRASLIARELEMTERNVRSVIKELNLRKAEK